MRGRGADGEVDETAREKVGWGEHSPMSSLDSYFLAQR